MKQLKLLTILLAISLIITFGFTNVQKAQAQPSNDNFEFATVISELPFIDSLNITEASTGSSDPSPCGSPPNNSVWYRFTPAINMDIRIVTSVSNFYPTVGVYTGDYGSLEEVACSPSYYNLDVYLTAGITYFIEVVSPGESYPGSETFLLQINMEQIFRPANDRFANARTIENVPYQNSESIYEATTEPGEPANCGWWYGVSHTIWYMYTPTEAGVISGNLETNYSLPYLAVYQGSSFDNLSLVTCDYTFNFMATPGVHYYFQIGTQDSYYLGDATLNVTFVPPPPAPPNDHVADATAVSSLPFSETVNNAGATTEPGEPNPGCLGGEMNRTFWYSYIPAESGSVAAEKDGAYYSFMAVYTADSLSTQTALHCKSYGFNRITFFAEAGIAYYFQLGNFGNELFSTLTFSLSVPPPPTADFWYSPGDPNLLDIVQFCDYSYDPVGEPFTQTWWEFGDGTLVETADQCVFHQFTADGDFSVWHKVQTADGRTAEITKVASVRTHDVAITRFKVPQSARVGQTRSITVGIRNNQYPETVTVELFKSTPYGFTWVGSINMSVPVRSENRITEFNFSYTFTNEDAEFGSMTFKAVARLDSGRDAYPADNEAISLPTRVSGYRPK
jgi:hypothetical protein